jgi:transcriptional regulator with XRE-family HTH domain
MTPTQFKDARLEAGLSVTEMAKLLNLREPYGNGADHVREYESGKRPISGPVVRIVQFLIAGYLGDPFVAMDLTTEEPADWEKRWADNPDGPDAA